MNVADMQQTLLHLVECMPESCSTGASINRDTPDAAMEAMVIVTVEQEPQRALLADPVRELTVVLAAVLKLPGYVRLLLAIGALAGDDEGLIVIPFEPELAPILRHIERRRGLWLSDDQAAHADQGETRDVRDSSTRWVTTSGQVLTVVRAFLGAVT